MNQLEFVHKFIDKTIERFNPDLFRRSDDEIIEQLEKIILSCQMTGLFTIKVKGFEVIDDYVEIQKTLRDYYDKDGKKTSKGNYDEDNRYNYIDLKDSDIRILVIHYFIAIKDERDECKVMIAVPKVVNKFYFYLNGNYYLPMYQIVDASTYNNSSTKNNKHLITQKTNFQPINIYRHQYTLNTTRGESVLITEYDCNVFSKTVPAALFLFAKHGLIKGLHELGVGAIFSINSEDIYHNDPDMYTFVPKRNPNIFISVPKLMCDGNAIVQHVVYTLCMRTDADITINDLYRTEYWVGKLGESFNSANKLIKGYNILSSFESILDINIQEQLNLPWAKKKDIYDILKWLIQEYTALRQKDTLDVTKKKIRCAEYIAATYAVKLNTNIYRLSNMGNRADIKSIKNVICIQPMFLINELTKSPLITFRNIVTDMDSLSALKFTYKGISGVGGKNAAISPAFRLLDISNMGILDPDASSPSDPGVTGALVPMLQPYHHGYLTDEPEPLTWEEEYSKLYDEWKKIKGLQEVIEFKHDVLKDEEAAKEIVMARMATQMASNVNCALADSIVQNNKSE